MTLHDRKSTNVLLYEKYQETKCLDKAIRQVDSLFREKVLDNVAFVDVFPAKDLYTAVGGKLCRCRGMVQDISLEPMLYKAAPQHFYATDASSEGDGTFIDVALYYVIPVPCNQHFYAISEDTSAATPQGSYSQTLNRKRGHRELGGTSDAPHHDVDVAQQAERFCSEVHRGIKRDMSPRIDRTQTQEQYLNLPYPATSKSLCTACIVMVPIHRGPNGLCERVININDVVDFYGFLHSPNDQTDPSVLEEDEFAQFSSWHAAELSRGLVSRLFCLSYRLLQERSPFPKHAPKSDFNFEHHRQLCKVYLEREVCGGDSLLAEYLVLHLCAQVSAHHDTTPIGDIPLLVTSKRIEPRAWSERIARITPVAEVFLDEKLLGSSEYSLGPSYDYEKNYLRTGIFQIANGSHVTVDCTHILASETDKLSKNRSWRDMLFDLVHKQELCIEYKYHSVSLSVNLAFLALVAADSDCVHPIFKFPLHIKWEPQASSSLAASDAALPTSEPARIREYLTRVHQLCPFLSDQNNIRDKLVEVMMGLSETFSNWNNHDPLVHNNTFSAIASLFRVQALSMGRESVGEEEIEFITRLERNRMERVQDRE